ncbi:MAG: hypothetical protein J7518_21035 [Nocardioidaceae bacterium]|nr:hypothetical protein [Nocardioidaceae bacterium]
MAESARRLAVVLALVVGVAAVWIVRHPPADARVVHDDGQGVLSATSATGGVSADAPTGERTWPVTFGALALCVTKAGARARLVRVRTSGEPQPLGVRYQLRRVPPLSERSGAGLTWTLIYSGGGFPPNLSNARLGGTFGLVDGTISQRCNGGETTNHGFTELLLEMIVGPAGARVARTYVDYTYDGKPHTLVIRWQMVACGSQTRKYCSTPEGTE